MPALRILQVLYSYEVGGSEIVGLELARQMAATGATVMCAALQGGSGPLRARCEQSGIETLDLNIREYSLLGRNGISRYLVRRLRELNLNGIHLHHLLALNKLGLPARLAGVPRVIATEHSIESFEASRVARMRARLAWRLAHHLTAVHDGIRSFLINSLGVAPERVSVIQNGVELAHWHRDDRLERRAEMGLTSEFVFAFVGRLAQVKNVPGLIRAYLRMRDRLAGRSCLLIAGNGPEMQECRALVAAHSRGADVRLLGEVADTRRVLALADAFVMNSYSEGSPRAMIEAMAAGLPCICPAVGGVPALLGGRGWLTEPQSEVSLALAMEQAIGNPQVAAEFGRLGQAHVRTEFDARQSLERYLQLFQAGR